MAELPSGTVTFLFTDIEGSTARWEHQPEAMRAALARHDALLRAAIHEHGGHVVKTMGDAFHAVFARAPDAVAAAVDAQRRLQAEPWGEIGAAAGADGAAHRRGRGAGRRLLRPAAEPGGPAAERRPRRPGAALAGDRTSWSATRCPTASSLLDLGEHRLKDLIRPERVFQLVAPGPAVRLSRRCVSLDARPHNLPIQPDAAARARARASPASASACSRDGRPAR